MTIAAHVVIARGDLVLVSRHGRLFHERVTGAEPAGRLSLAPLERHVRDRSARVEDVIEHWSRTPPAARARLARGQLQLEGWPR